MSNYKKKYPIKGPDGYWRDKANSIFDPKRMKSEPDGIPSVSYGGYFQFKNLEEEKTRRAQNRLSKKQLNDFIESGGVPVIETMTGQNDKSSVETDVEEIEPEKETREKEKKESGFSFWDDDEEYKPEEDNKKGKGLVLLGLGGIGAALLTIITLGK